MPRKPAKTQREIPDVTVEEVAEHMRKTATVTIRLTPAERASMERAREELGLSLTDYIVKAHAVVSRKLRTR